MTEPTDKRLGSPTHSEAEQGRARVVKWLRQESCTAQKFMSLPFHRRWRAAFGAERGDRSIRTVALSLFLGRIVAGSFDFSADAIEVRDHLKGVE